MARPGRPKITSGPGQSAFHGTSYLYVVRMLAENFPPTRILGEIHKKFPEHRPNGDSPVSLSAVKSIKKKRSSEVDELRQELNERAGKELWIANRFQRLKQMQNIYEDANRWVPKRAITVVEDGARRSVLVYEKETGMMLKTLAQAREELGEDSGSRQAQSLEDLVKLAEQERGLQLTEEIDVTPVDAVPKATDVELIDPPDFYPSAGDDPERGILDGEHQLDDYVEIAADRPDGD